MIPGLKVKSYKRGRRWAPELRLTAGPAAEGVTGGGTHPELWGHNWGSALDRDRGLVVLRDLAGTWAEVATLTPVPTVDPRLARHHGSAFDGSGRPTFTWEEAGQVYLQQWDPVNSEVITRGPFPGVDPVLINDATAHGQPAQADVVLLHLNPDRTQLIGRLERNQYGSPQQLTSLTAGSMLDQLAAGDGLLYAWGAHANGDPWYVPIGLYPFDLGHDHPAVPTFGFPSAFTRVPVVVVEELGYDQMQAVLGFPAAFTRVPVVLQEDLGHDELAAPTFGFPAAFTRIPMVLHEALGYDELLPAFGFPAAFTPTLAVVSVPLGEDHVQAAFGFPSAFTRVPA